MAVGDRQKLITKIVGIVLGQTPEYHKFDWFVNKHQQEHFKESYPIIADIYKTLNGNNSVKRITKLQSDAYFAGNYNLLFEFDEFQHFTTARLKTFNNYPKNIKLNYSLSDWKKNCEINRAKADKYRFNKTTSDFKFLGGRTNQRAYLDCFRDLLPSNNGLNPTLRISEFEVVNINAVNDSAIEQMREIISSKLLYI